MGFDDLAGGSCNLCGPSVTNQYAGLGVTFSNPSFPGQDTADTNLTFGIPNSSGPNALFVFQGGGLASIAPFQIHFSIPVNTVGFDYASSLDAFLQVDAYAPNGTFLETLTYVGSSTPVGLGGFAGIEEASNIGRLDLSYHPNFNPALSYNFSIDNVAFVETPEPATGALAGIGILGLVWVKRKLVRAASRKDLRDGPQDDLPIQL